MDSNYSGNYVWSTLVFSPPLQGSEFKFYVEAGCTIRNDSNNQVATASSTGDLLVPDDGTGLLSSVSFSVTNGQGGVTGPYVDGVLTTNAVEIDQLNATASYGIPVVAKVISTNLATPSITTDGGNWIGTDDTGLNGKGGILNEFMSQSTFVSTTNASTLTYNQSLPGSLPATQAMVFRNGVTNIDVTYAFHVYSSTDGINWTRVASKVNEPQTFSAPYLAVASDDDQAGTGTITGSAATGEDKVTGPLKTTEVAGPYLTLSPSSGRWLVTETGYSTLLKLNKFVKSSSVQSVASLFTVMDALGNVTDLTTEDPGYTNMVGDPTYTLTFPSVFPSGETPDVELSPGTKYQVEVKATNDIGVDNAFSNDVMPVAGLLQTSVITAAVTSGGVQNLVTGGTWELLDGTATNLAGGNPMTSWPVVFDSNPASYSYFNYSAVSSLVSTYRYTFAEPIPFTTLKAYVGSYTANSIYWVRFNGGTPLRGGVNTNTQLIDYTNAVNGDTELRTLEIGTDGPNYSLISGIEIDGVLLGAEYTTSITTLTTVDTTNYNLFSAGDEVVESSGGTPVTSAITNVSDAQLPAQVFSVCDRSSDTMTPYSGNYGQLFDGAAGTSSSGPSWSNGNSGTATLFDLSSSIPLTSLEFQMTGAADFGIKITDGAGVVHTITPFSGPGGGAYTSVPVSGISSIKKVQVDGYGNAFGMYSIKLNGSLMVDNVALAYGTLLTFTNDTNLANFRVGDQLGGGSGFNPVIYTGNGTSQDITTGMAPDFVWIKMRSSTENHWLFDTVRGANKALYSDSTSVENTYTDSLTSFNADGFSLGARNGVNFSGEDMVAWCWSAGNTTVTNNDGSIASQVRSNGNFSIVSYTGNNTLSTIGHGLSSNPKLIIAKSLKSENDWAVYTETVGTGSFLALNTPGAAIDSTGVWGNEASPTSTVFTVGDGNQANYSDEMIAYCWAESPTQSFGSYTGNSSTSGPVIDCGFAPAFVMVKCTTNGGTSWNIVDSARGVDYQLYADFA